MNARYTIGECLIRDPETHLLHYLGAPCAASEAVERLNAAASADKAPDNADLLLVEGLAIYDADVDPAVVII
jgi:hypothetical protein